MAYKDLEQVWKEMRNTSAGTESSQLVKGGLWAKGREECKTRGHYGLSGPHAGFKRFSLRNSPDVTTALWTIQHFSFLLQSEKVFKSEFQGIFWVDKFSLSCITSFEITGTEKRKWCFPPKWKPQYVLETRKIVPRGKKKELALRARLPQARYLQAGSWLAIGWLAWVTGLDLQVALLAS